MGKKGLSPKKKADRIKKNGPDQEKRKDLKKQEGPKGLSPKKK